MKAEWTYYLRQRGGSPLHIEAVWMLADTRRAKAAREWLGFGRRRGRSVVVGMADLPSFLEALDGPRSLIEAAKCVRGTLLGVCESRDDEARKAAIEALSFEYQRVTREI